jgi:hypothetical protein
VRNAALASLVTVRRRLGESRSDGGAGHPKSTPGKRGARLPLRLLYGAYADRAGTRVPLVALLLDPGSLAVWLAWWGWDAPEDAGIVVQGVELDGLVAAVLGAAEEVRQDATHVTAVVAAALGGPHIGSAARRTLAWLLAAIACHPVPAVKVRSAAGRNLDECAD